MKKFIFSIVLLAITTTSFSQPTDPSVPLTRADYLAKSKGQKTAAWILLGVGATCLAIAAPGNIDFGTLPILVIGGGLAAVSSIPLFISAAKNKKRANKASASIRMETLPEIQKAFFANKIYPAVSLKINL